VILNRPSSAGARHSRPCFFPDGLFRLRCMTLGGSGYQPPIANYQPVTVIRKQGAWALWWLCVLSFGIYYLVWYHRINRELSALLGVAVRANGKWWNQLIPIWNLVGLGSTAKRLNGAHAKVGSPTRVGVFVAWFWAPWWFASQTRYLQRRINILHDVLASHTVGAVGYQPTA